MEGIMSIFNGLLYQIQLNRVAGFVRSEMIEAESNPRPVAPASPSPLLAFAIRENSNLESNWLWYASRMLEEQERQYCLAYAAWIANQRAGF
jgi:hypothetical protein